LIVSTHTTTERAASVARFLFHPNKGILMPKDSIPVINRVIKGRHGELTTPGFDSRPYTLTMRAGVNFEDVLKPIYWTSFAEVLGVNTKFHPHIYVVNDQHTFFAELYVRSVQENQVFVEVLNGPFVYGETETAEDATLEISWNVGKKDFFIRRVKDKQVLKDGFGTNKEAAKTWLDDHMAKIAA
jgi:hypothetical protein